MVVVGGGDGGGEGEQTERNNEKGEREGGGDVERHKNNWKGTRREGERDKTGRGKAQTFGRLQWVLRVKAAQLSEVPQNCSGLANHCAIHLKCRGVQDSV
jgi:hypothetical protein